MSATPIDLTLPDNCFDTVERFLHIPNDLLPFALYTHVQLPASELKQVIEICQSQLEEGSPGVIKLPKSYDQVGQPLRASYDVQVEQVAPSQQFDPFYFVAVVDQDWRDKGLVVVTLDDDEGDCHADHLLIPAAEVGLMLVNLQIANMNWDDYKDHHESGGDNGEDGAGSEASSKIDETEEGIEHYSDGASNKVPSIGY